MLTPDRAHRIACDTGPSEKTRRIACQDPSYAYLYAYSIDTLPHPTTQKAVMPHNVLAYYYTLNLYGWLPVDIYKEVPVICRAILEEELEYD